MEEEDKNSQQGNKEGKTKLTPEVPEDETNENLIQTEEDLDGSEMVTESSNPIQTMIGVSYK